MRGCCIVGANGIKIYVIGKPLFKVDIFTWLLKDRAGFPLLTQTYCWICNRSVKARRSILVRDCLVMERAAVTVSLLTSLKKMAALRECIGRLINFFFDLARRTVHEGLNEIKCLTITCSKWIKTIWRKKNCPNLVRKYEKNFVVVVMGWQVCIIT